jgi:predicted kinase
MTHHGFQLGGPTLCIVVGVPASGKTSLARQIARQLVDAAYLSKDLVQTEFTNQRLDGDAYSLVRGPTFALLVSFAKIQLSLGKTPIIDAPFSINHWRNDDLSDWEAPFQKAAAVARARLAIVRCLPPSLDDLRKRIKQRGAVWDRWKLENWDEFLRREPPDFPIRHADQFEVVTDKPVENSASIVLTEFLHATPLGSEDPV